LGKQFFDAKGVSSVFRGILPRFNSVGKPVADTPLIDGLPLTKYNHGQ
jgi:hypothetical protein